LTSDTDRCAAYQAASQNVKSRWYCKVSQTYIDQQLANNENRMGFIPITQSACVAIGGDWTEVAAWGTAAPVCDKHPITRDNHHGHPVGSSFWPRWNWTIPGDITLESCVLRMRYNMTSSETRLFGEWKDETTECGDLNRTLNYRRQNGAQENNDDPQGFRYASRVPVWSRYRIRVDEIAANLDYNLFTLAPVSSKRGFVLGDDPLVDIFGSLLTGGKTLQLRLAVDTSQFSRTFEDRSHTFAIRPAPTQLGGLKIHNLGVRGKRGNIVQVYPSVEYDFSPEELYVSRGEFIHFQWTGSNTNPNNNAGQGTQGTDRSNIIILRDKPPMYQNDNSQPYWANPPPAGTQLLPIGLRGPHPGHTGGMKQNYPARVDDTSSTADLAGINLLYKTALARAGIYTPHVDIGPLQMKNQGIFDYICTRNNAFTNRDQKGRLVVGDVNAGTQYQEIDVAGMFAQLVASSGEAWLRFTPDPIALTTGSQLRVEFEGDRVHVTPLFFDVVPGQSILLEIKYTQSALQDIYIMQSDTADDAIVYEMSTSAQGGIASTKINRGGYYWIDKRTSVGPVVGIVFGCVVAVGGVALLYWKLRSTFTYGGKKAHLMDTNTAVNTA